MDNVPEIVEDFSNSINIDGLKSSITRHKITIGSQIALNLDSASIIEKHIRVEYDLKGMTKEIVKKIKLDIELQKNRAILEINMMKAASKLSSDLFVRYLGGIAREISYGRKKKYLGCLFSCEITGYAIELQIYMESCFGDLIELQNNPNWDYEPNNIQIFANVVEAVYLLHMNGIAHRDIKPDNIFVCGTSQNIKYKLADFEFSTTDKVSKDCIGTEGYAAPELYNEKEKVDGIWNSIKPYDTMKVDIYALGVTFIIIFNYINVPLSNIECYVGIKRQLIELQSFKDLFEQMMHCEPDNRPTMEEIYTMLSMEASPVQQKRNTRSATK